MCCTTRTPYEKLLTSHISYEIRNIKIYTFFEWNIRTLLFAARTSTLPKNSSWIQYAFSSIFFRFIEHSGHCDPWFTMKMNSLFVLVCVTCVKRVLGYLSALKYCSSAFLWCEHFSKVFIRMTKSFLPFRNASIFILVILYISDPGKSMDNHETNFLAFY